MGKIVTFECDGCGEDCGGDKPMRVLRVQQLDQRYVEARSYPHYAEPWNTVGGELTLCDDCEVETVLFAADAPSRKIGEDGEIEGERES